MLIPSKDFAGLHLQASDGAIGTVKDLFFDTETWILRYFVVDTGGWLKGRQVLISPVAAHSPAWDDKKLPVDLTREQVRHSPSVELDQPVSRQHEILLHEHYGWPQYWAAAAAYSPTGVGFSPPVPPVVPTAEASDREASDPATATEDHPPRGDPHLHSMHDVRGYKIAAIDGDIGHVEDFLIDVKPWKVACLLVDTRTWWAGKSVLVAPDWIRSVYWTRREVQVDLMRDTIQRAPEYDRTQAVDHAYLERLRNFYRQQYPPAS